MPNPTGNSGIRDNHRRGVVADFLKAKIQSGSRLSVVSAYFTIYAYEALKDCLAQIDHLDFLFGEPRFIASLDPDKTEKKAFILDGNGLQLANKLQQKRVARECADWMRQKVDIRSIRHAQLLHGKMYHIANGGVEEAILGSSNFTVRGLGLGAGNNNIELNLVVDSNRDRQDLKHWFEELWADDELTANVKDDVLLYLDQLYQNHPPEFIYFKTLFHVFEFRRIAGICGSYGHGNCNCEERASRSWAWSLHRHDEGRGRDHGFGDNRSGAICNSTARHAPE